MTYIAGQHYFICDVCGFKFKSSQKRKRWDNLIVCPDDYETDHPQKYIRVEPDGLPVLEPRPRPEDTFDYVCYIFAKQAYADLAEADCAQADLTTYTYSQAYEMKGHA